MTGNREQQLSYVEKILFICSLDPSISFREIAQQIVEGLIPSTSNNNEKQES